MDLSKYISEETFVSHYLTETDYGTHGEMASRVLSMGNGTYARVRVFPENWVLPIAEHPLSHEQFRPRYFLLDVLTKNEKGELVNEREPSSFDRIMPPVFGYIDMMKELEGLAARSIAPNAGVPLKRDREDLAPDNELTYDKSLFLKQDQPPKVHVGPTYPREPSRSFSRPYRAPGEPLGTSP